MLPYKRDVGTGNSDLTYQALAGVAYGFRWGILSLTYRYLFYDEAMSSIRDKHCGTPGFAGLVTKHGERTGLTGRALLAHMTVWIM